WPNAEGPAAYRKNTSVPESQFSERERADFGIQQHKNIKVFGYGRLREALSDIEDNRHKIIW
ncbi:MAG: hypothetical protein QGI29_01520, partial [Pirellulales bacterium]|nr:hypothetical protein [Pirellulales bacterium]